jgi:hypothetical protein
MDFINHREGGYCFLSDFPPVSFTVYSTVRGCVSLKKYKSQGKDFCLDFVREFGLGLSVAATLWHQPAPINERTRTNDKRQVELQANYTINI